MGRKIIYFTMTTAKLEMLPINIIELDKENPRIKHFLEMYTDITSEMIALALTDSSSGDASTSYRALRDSIKVSKGIIHPIVVNNNENGTYTVIEGNTRLQIYKEFAEIQPNGPWNTIPCLIYKQLTNIQKHEIRLQSHLVGPRDWDPYSKAKYLYQLSEIEHLPMNSIISMCGGGKSEIEAYISAYIYMEKYYRTYVKQVNLDFNTRDFSKFVEYQKSTIKNAIKRRHIGEEEFAKWVANGNIDKAQGVRAIPKIFHDDEVFEVFLKSNITEAEKVLHAKELVNEDLSKYPYEALCKELSRRMMDIKYSEINSLATDSNYDDKLYALEDALNQLKFIVDAVHKITE